MSYSIMLRLLFISAFILSTTKSDTQISFPQFSQLSNDSTLTTVGDVQYNPDNHSFIINSKSVTTLVGTCGALQYGDTLSRGGVNVRIRDSANDKLASFNTSFTFTFRSPPQPRVYDQGANYSNNRSGTSFVFVLVKSATMDHLAAAMMDFESWAEQPGPCSYALGADYQRIAIQFKSSDYNYYTGDPSNNFIGILDPIGDFVFEGGSTHNLCGNTTYCSYLDNGESFTAWIDLTPERTLQIRLANGSYPTVDKPSQPLLERPNLKFPAGFGDFATILFIGSSRENHIQTHEISSWNFSVSEIPKTIPSSQRKSWIRQRKWIYSITGASGIVVVLLVLSFIWIWLIRRHRITIQVNPPVPHIFSYRELCKATRNFKESEKLGSGGFGTVYRGSFTGSGNNLVAVKRIHYESRHAEATFLAEIYSLSQIRHRNVVQLQGWCHEKGRLLLVYDYISNGSLNGWLHDSRKATLSLKLRYYILEGIAAAIEYLHKDCFCCVLHRDIKSSNVMLDANFKAHLGDFGLARLMDHEKLDKTTMAAGTIGYMAPEVPYTGKATKESDVYSFGILMLEVVSGRRPLDFKALEPVLLYSIWQAHEAGTLLGMADPGLMLQNYQPSQLEFHHGESTCVIQTQPTSSNPHNDLNDNNVHIMAIEDDDEGKKMVVKNLLHLGLLCCLPDPAARPSMGHVISILQQIGNIKHANYTISDVSMPPLPDTNPFGPYRSMEFSRTAPSISQQSLSVAFSSISETESPLDEILEESTRETKLEQ